MFLLIFYVCVQPAISGLMVVFVVNNIWSSDQRCHSATRLSTKYLSITSDSTKSKIKHLYFETQQAWISFGLINFTIRRLGMINANETIVHLRPMDLKMCFLINWCVLLSISRLERYHTKWSTIRKSAKLNAFNWLAYSAMCYEITQKINHKAIRAPQKRRWTQVLPKIKCIY